MATEAYSRTILCSIGTCRGVQVELLRLCKRVPSPSFCLVESSDVYKADCKECNCQTCHSCQCVIKLSEHCPYDTCDSCLGAPLIKCCYEADCK